MSFRLWIEIGRQDQLDEYVRNGERSPSYQIAILRNGKIELPLSKLEKNGEGIGLVGNSSTLIYVCFYWSTRLLAICDYFILVSKIKMIPSYAQLFPNTSIFLIHSYSEVVIICDLKSTQRYSLFGEFSITIFIP